MNCHLEQLKVKWLYLCMEPAYVFTCTFLMSKHGNTKECALKSLIFN